MVPFWCPFGEVIIVMDIQVFFLESYPYFNHTLTIFHLKKVPKKYIKVYKRAFFDRFI